MSDLPVRPPAIVLAAGAGSRLGSLGQRYSKPTVPVAGRPLIAWVVDELAAAGIGRVVVVGHPGDARLAAWCRAQVPAIDVVTQPQRRGIADALVHALPSLGEAPAYLACACDSLYRPDDVAAFVRRAQRIGVAALLGVLEMGVSATPTRSAVVLDGTRVVRIVEKPPPGDTPSGLVALPLYWLPRTVDPYLQLQRADGPGGEAYVTTALDAYARAGGCVWGQSMRERVEITTADDIARAEVWLRNSPRGGCRR